MASKTDYFWTDVNQASDRLHGTVILYDDRPCYVEEVLAHDDKPKARIIFCDDRKAGSVRKELNSPKFNKFRTLPKLGFVNRVSDSRLLLLSRAVVSTRRHGYCGDNINVKVLFNMEPSSDGLDRIPYFSGNRDSAAFNSNVFFDLGFTATHKGQFPSLDAILQKLNPSTGLAFHNNFAVVRDSTGMRWLFRLDQRVGFFSDATSLVLFPRFSYLRQEIMEEPSFKPVASIREY